MIAQGKRSAAVGYRCEMISSFFLPVWRATGAPNRKEKRGWVGRLFTQGGGLGGLALGLLSCRPWRGSGGRVATRRR